MPEHQSERRPEPARATLALRERRVSCGRTLPPDGNMDSIGELLEEKLGLHEVLTSVNVFRFYKE